MSHYRLAAYPLACMLLTSGLARADCIEDPRPFKLDGSAVVKLKGYTCSEGGSPQIKVEFHRFSDIPAGLLMAKTSSALLTRVIGSPRIVENDVFKTYADMLKQFGWTQEAPKKDDGFPTRTTISLDPNGPSTDDSIRAGKVRTLQGLYTQHDGWIYPAAAEIGDLRKKRIPEGVNYFYSVKCAGEDQPPTGQDLCKSKDNIRITQNFWRSMRAADVSDYAKNLSAFNAQLKEAKKDAFTGLTPRGLNLVQYFAGSQWPDDFLIMTGNQQASSCGSDESGIFGWEFQYWPRDSVLEAVIVENLSKQPIKIGTFYGERFSQPHLRASRSTPDASSSAGTALGEIALTLAPGARVLYPTGIRLFVNENLKKMFDHPEAATQVRDQVGAGGFTGNTGAYRLPTFKDYVFGSELDVTGILVNGRRVDFRPADANFIDLTVSALIGSCPYLLAWDSRDHEWVDTGCCTRRRAKSASIARPAGFVASARAFG
jgi:hypothetical protein